MIRIDQREKIPAQETPQQYLQPSEVKVFMDKLFSSTRFFTVRFWEQRNFLSTADHSCVGVVNLPIDDAVVSGLGGALEHQAVPISASPK